MIFDPDGWGELHWRKSDGQSEQQAGIWSRKKEKASRKGVLWYDRCSCHPCAFSFCSVPFSPGSGEGREWGDESRDRNYGYGRSQSFLLSALSAGAGRHHSFPRLKRGKQCFIQEPVCIAAQDHRPPGRNRSDHGRDGLHQWVSAGRTIPLRGDDIRRNGSICAYPQLG